MNSSEAAVDTFPYFAIVKMYRRSLNSICFHLHF